MSLLNMPYRVKCAWKLRNAAEIRGLDSVHSSYLCLGPVRVFVRRGPRWFCSSRRFCCERGREQSLGACTKHKPIALNRGAVWLKISK